MEKGLVEVPEVVPIESGFKGSVCGDKGQDSVSTVFGYGVGNG